MAPATPGSFRSLPVMSPSLERPLLHRDLGPLRGDWCLEFMIWSLVLVVSGVSSVCIYAYVYVCLTSVHNDTSHSVPAPWGSRLLPRSMCLPPPGKTPAPSKHSSCASPHVPLTLLRPHEKEHRVNPRHCGSSVRLISRRQSAVLRSYLGWLFSFWVVIRNTIRFIVIY